MALFSIGSRLVGAGEVGLAPQYDVARDGRFLINVIAEDTVGPITLLQNWQPPTGP